jgi:hypothetical protein
MANEWTVRIRLNRMTVVAAVGFVYFVAFPEDLSAVLLPVERVLSLTTQVSPWLYVVLGGAVVAWAVVRVLGRRPEFPSP